MIVWNIIVSVLMHSKVHCAPLQFFVWDVRPCIIVKKLNESLNSHKLPASLERSQAIQAARKSPRRHSTCTSLLEMNCKEKPRTNAETAPCWRMTNWRKLRVLAINEPPKENESRTPMNVHHSRKERTVSHYTFSGGRSVTWRIPKRVERTEQEGM